MKINSVKYSENKCNIHLNTYNKRCKALRYLARNATKSLFFNDFFLQTLVIEVKKDPYTRKKNC